MSEFIDLSKMPSGFTIERNGMQIELSSQELMNAYEKYSHDTLVEDIKLVAAGRGEFYSDVTIADIAYDIETNDAIAAERMEEIGYMMDDYEPDYIFEDIVLESVIKEGEIFKDIFDDKNNRCECDIQLYNIKNGDETVIGTAEFSWYEDGEVKLLTSDIDIPDGMSFDESDIEDAIRTNLRDNFDREYEASVYIKDNEELFEKYYGWNELDDAITDAEDIADKENDDLDDIDRDDEAR